MSVAFFRPRSDSALQEHLASILNTRGQAGSLLLLLPGGSAVATLGALHDTFRLLPTRHITLTDERYGEVGHADSNWQHLKLSGVVLDDLTDFPVLQGKPIEQTARDFSVFLEHGLQSSDYRIGIFGIGTDHHTAGLLPHAPALDSKAYADHYQGHDFSRITITSRTIEALDEAIVIARGSSKKDVIAALHKTADWHDQPAQLLLRVPRLTIYNDYKGEIL